MKTSRAKGSHRESRFQERGALVVMVTKLLVIETSKLKDIKDSLVVVFVVVVLVIKQPRAMMGGRGVETF